MGKQQTHSLLNQSNDKGLVESERKLPRTYPCSCGLEFENRNELWIHMTTCQDIRDSRQTCSICSEPGEIFLSQENIERICPTCAIGYFESKKILGVNVINHMGIEYENAFREKAGVLLKCLNVQTLTDLGITMVLITFSADNSAAYCISPKGEVVYVLNNTEALRKTNYESFVSVISHEIFHAYVTNKLKLGIGKLHHAFTAVGASGVQVAEDIELIKIALEKNVEPLLADEVDRTKAYYKDLQKPVPMKYWVSVPDHLKFVSMVSVTWSYAATEWLMQNVKDQKLKELFSQNLELVRPHYSVNGSQILKDLVTELLSSKAVTTGDEAEIVFQKILHVYDGYLYANNLDLY